MRRFVLLSLAPSLVLLVFVLAGAATPPSGRVASAAGPTPSGGEGQVAEPIATVIKPDVGRAEPATSNVQPQASRAEARSNSLADSRGGGWPVGMIGVVAGAVAASFVLITGVARRVVRRR